MVSVDLSARDGDGHVVVVLSGSGPEPGRPRVTEPSGPQIATAVVSLAATRGRDFAQQQGPGSLG